jgi:hypothetical protein
MNRRITPLASGFSEKLANRAHGNHRRPLTW